MMSNRLFKIIAINIIFIWLAVLALLPFIMFVVASFLQQGDENLFNWHLTVINYTQLINPIFLHIFWRSLVVSVITTILCLALGYPFAYILAQLSEKLRLACLFLIIIPFWTSSLIRSYAIITILKSQGLLNQLLLTLHIIHQPLHILYTQYASQVGLVYSLLPFMVLPLYATLEKFDWRLVDAARDLGANRLRAFWQIVVPISAPGIIAGVMLVLLPAMTLFYIPEILGGAKSILLGNLIKNQFLEGQNWPLGSSISIVLTFFMALLIGVYWKFNKNKKQVLI